MFRIRELKKEKRHNSKATVNEGLPMAKGKATPGCPSMEYPSHYVLPSRKRSYQGVKTLPAASERAREERAVCGFPVTQDPGPTEQEAETLNSLKGRS